MNIYDDLTKNILGEANSIRDPLREFERLYGLDFRQLYAESENQRLLLKTALPDVDLGVSFRSALESLQPAVDHLSDLGGISQAMTLLAKTYQSFSGPLGLYTDRESISQASLALGRDWQEGIGIYRRFQEEAATAEFALKAHYTAMAESALLAHERLLHVPWDSLGSATLIERMEFRSISDAFTSLVDKYRMVLESFEQRENFLAGFPPVVSAGPPVEMLTSARLLDSLSRPTPGNNDSENGESERERDLEAEIETSVEELLAAVNPELRPVWLGAREALKSKNPDRARHVVVSLRELVTHVLNSLAPSDEVKAWSNDPNHFDQGRPTRAARVLFMCRGVNHGPFSRFIDADVRANIEFIALFQRGTHELAVAFSEVQLRALVTRTESMLRFLLLTSRVKG